MVERSSTIFVTFPDQAQARKICRHLLTERMAACANLFSIDSMYWWDGKIEESAEWGALLKVRSEDFEIVCKEIKKMHPYEVPCIVRYEIDEGFDDYLQWIRGSTARPRKD